MQKKNKNEIPLNTTYEKCLEDTRLEHVRYEFIDFHHIFKGSDFTNVDKYIRKYTNMMKLFGFYCKD